MKLSLSIQNKRTPGSRLFKNDLLLQHVVAECYVACYHNMLMLQTLENDSNIKCVFSL